MIGIVLAAALSALPIRPDAKLTPGATQPVTVKAVCTPGYSSKARSVSAKTKRDVFGRYQIVPSGKFEIDHLISLELGGSNDVENLWPQSYLTKQNAHLKDALENRLHWMVCHGTLPLETAQREIRTDWIKAYDAYITHGPKKGTK